MAKPPGQEPNPKASEAVRAVFRRHSIRTPEHQEDSRVLAQEIEQQVLSKQVAESKSPKRRITTSERLLREAASDPSTIIAGNPDWKPLTDLVAGALAPNKTRQDDYDPWKSHPDSPFYGSQGGTFVMDEITQQVLDGYPASGNPAPKQSVYIPKGSKGPKNEM